MKQGLEDVSGLLELAVEADDEETFNEAVAELDALEEKLAQLEFRRMFSGEYDSADCYLDIQAGSGGTEAQDWASMLERMYLRWAESRGFKTEIIEESEGEVAGIKSVTIKISGDYAYGWLRTETGVHRLVRKSPFDSGGRRHTSFSSAFVYPEVDDDIDIEINPADLRIDVYRASGAGGQHVNRTESAVRITHIPTGIVTQCQNDRSQHKNKDQAMKQMKAKLYELEMQKKNAEKQAMEDNKSDIGWGSQIRSYVLDDSRIKDLRTGVETRNTQAVLDGSLDQFIEASLKAGLWGTNMSEQHAQGADAVVDLNNELKTHREKLANLREQGVAFPNDFRRDHTSDQLHAEFDGKENEELEALNIEVAVAGRMMTRRIMGKASFVTLQDVGGRIQLYVARDDLPEGVYNEQFKKWDLGDILGAKGKLFKTKTGELSIHCTELRLLTKALRPLPDKFHGLQDQEARYRQRYLDLISNDESRNTFKVRSQILSGIRQFMVNRGFMEVETPMMQVIPGGAAARPFITHHNALDLDMYLRIAPELYLKRLVVGGFERVFEINRNFRNEGISVRHNPEFTMMELYMAYADYKDLIELTESLFRTLAQDILGKTEVTYGDVTLDFGKPFEKLTMREAIKKYRPETDMADLDNFDSAKAIAESIGIHVEKSWGLGRIVTEIFEEVAEAHLIQPTFITEYPAEVSPLARRNDINPEITDRFEFFIGGREIGNGFSELNDAEDQAQRFLDQVAAKDAGDDEAMFYDEDYVTALEHGLPPTAGLGIGIDRMVMLFTNSHTIRDVILFPAMRPVK